MSAIGIYGSAGRMGRAIAQVARDEGVAIAGGADAGDDPVPLARAADVLLDFSIAGAVEAHVAAAVDCGTPIVVGTTGLNPRHHAAIAAAAERVAVLQTGNTSLGVTLLEILVRDAAARLGPEWDIEIAETHHRHKVDAPSGTALLLGEAAAAGRGTTLAEVRVDGRAGLVGARSEGTIGFASVRGGSVIGDHDVIFAGDGERVQLGHRADDRITFARGAVRAALWLAGQPAGRYRMGDVLGLWTTPEVAEFFRRLAAATPQPETELRAGNVYQLLVAVVLSAQSTDAGVNRATEALFREVATPAAMVALGEARLRGHIRTIGLFNTKAKNVIALSEALIRDHGGEVPADRDALERLPGVGRKTANVMLNTAFGHETFAVDTHIFRVCNRTGLAPGKTPLVVEAGLEAATPAPYRLGAHHWLILHGRYVCKARRPECWRCIVADLCAFTPKTAAPA